MNMLQVQDALKNASDDQLMREMTNPTGMAPQFLVLSEMKRRKDMRAKVEPPQGTVADDLLAQDDGGIRDMVAQENPEAEPAEEMAAGGLASLRHYRAGGAIRYSEGGVVDPDDPNLTPFESLLARRRRDAEERQARIERNLAIERSTSGQRRDAGIFGFFAAPQGRRAESERVVQGTDNQRRNLVENPAEFERFQSNPGGFATEIPDPPPPAPPLPGTTVAPVQNTEQRQGEARPGGNQGGSQTRVTGQGSTPTSASPAQAQPDGISEGIQRLANSLPDRISGLARRLEEGRTDPASRRSEAMNMALIDAGLRIAGSNSPRLAGAIAEGGVPALQAFSQAQQQIRQDQRADDREALQLALAQNQRDFYLGRLSAQELDMRNRRDIAEMQERRADARSAAAANRSPEAQRLWEFMNPGQRFDPSNPAHVDSMNTILTRARGELQGANNQERAMVNPQLRAQVTQELYGQLRREPTPDEVTAAIRRMYPDPVRFSTQPRQGSTVVSGVQ